MSRSTLVDLRDWLGVVAAFATVLALTLTPPLGEISPRQGVQFAADSSSSSDLYAARQ